MEFCKIFLIKEGIWENIWVSALFPWSEKWELIEWLEQETVADEILCLFFLILCVEREDLASMKIRKS